MQEYMITFPNTHSAIQGEKTLLAGGLSVGVMPMPSAVSAGCGICLRIPADSVPAAKGLLDADNVATDGWYRITTEHGATTYLKDA